jgi:hypothetical protein
MSSAQRSARVSRRKQRDEMWYPCVRGEPFEFLLEQDLNALEWNIKLARQRRNEMRSIRSCRPMI